jgi:large subunit ribosomal protein L6
MKNIFKVKINPTQNFTLFLKKNKLFVKGNLGTSCLDVSFLNNPNLNISSHSSFFRLFQKSIIGVSLGFVNSLSFSGVGFRLESLNDKFMKLKLGFSHFIILAIPPYIQVSSLKKTQIILKCLDEQLLNEFCSKIISFKYPDVYKGKGILYKNQVLFLKEGKKK